ncbi:hypothetical protein [Sphingobacterium sp.]|uniref:O-antigen ligase family protein n=1 Tax=Sphingobacterium sp. TaxID=341027 RepID=UPI0028A0B204|nr:hypothetical protein [Sphingobacterium sp.]
MKKKINISNTLYLGFFLVLWSVNGYFVGGNALKYLILAVGLLMIFSYNINSYLKKHKGWVEISIFASLYFLLIIFKAFLQEQYTTSPTIIIFGVTNILLFTTGVLFSKNPSLFTLPSKRTILIIYILTFIGAIFFFVFQNSLVISTGTSGRAVGGEDDGVNVIGIAYTNALIFIILFIIHRFLGKRSKLMSYTALALMLLSVLVIIQTQSRGAIIYLAIIIFLFSFSGLKLQKAIPMLMRTFIYLFLGALLIFTFIKINPGAQRSFDGFMNRMDDLVGSVQGTSVDRSSEEREDKYNDFFNNYDQYLFVGQKHYIPYPHNIFIEIIQRFGLILGIPLIMVILTCVIRSIRYVYNKEPDMVLILFSMVFLFSFFQSLSSMSLEMNRTLWLSMGVLFGKRKLVTNN